MQLIREPKHGDAIDALDTPYPSRLNVVEGPLALDTATSTYYGYVVTGTARVADEVVDARLGAGSFFCAPGPLRVDAAGQLVIIERLGFRGMVGMGRIEAEGRLAYIDGCSDSVLVAPPRLGDPVLNFLHFPPDVRQSPHTHPSIRLGVVARGSGTAFGPTPRGEWTHGLQPGSVFCLAAHELHAFRTTESHSTLDVVAYHPDSDWGPTDGVHPMLNRTFVAPE